MRPSDADILDCLKGMLINKKFGNDQILNDLLKGERYPLTEKDGRAGSS